MCGQVLGKVGQGVLELLIGNEKVTDGQTDRHVQSNMFSMGHKKTLHITVSLSWFFRNSTHLEEKKFAGCSHRVYKVFHKSCNSKQHLHTCNNVRTDNLVHYTYVHLITNLKIKHTSMTFIINGSVL